MMDLKHHMDVTPDGWPSCTCGSEFATWADLEDHCNHYQEREQR